MSENALTRKIKANSDYLRDMQGQSVRFRYQGGSQPGSSRSARSLKVDDGGRVLTKDEDDQFRTFIIENLDTLSDDEPDESPAYRRRR